MNISFINFKNLELDFSNNYFQALSFNYLGSSYSFNLYPKVEDIYIYSPNFVVARLAVNKIIKTTSLDLIFCQPSMQDDKDLNLETIFSKYKLGVISNV